MISNVDHTVCLSSVHLCVPQTSGFGLVNTANASKPWSHCYADDTLVYLNPDTDEPGSFKCLTDRCNVIKLGSNTPEHQGPGRVPLVWTSPPVRNLGLIFDQDQFSDICGRPGSVWGSLTWRC